MEAAEGLERDKMGAFNVGGIGYGLAGGFELF
jgi:hypothetical protein